MKKNEDFISCLSVNDAVLVRRAEYLEARAEYEISLRRFLNGVVKNCPCCFKGFYKLAENDLREQMIEEGTEPDELEVLEEMRSRSGRNTVESNEDSIN